MKKFLSLVIVLIFITAGTAWAKHKKGESTGSESKTHKTHSHSKHSKSPISKKKKSKTAKKSSKTKAEAKVETGASKNDVTIDLKGQ